MQLIVLALSRRTHVMNWVWEMMVVAAVLLEFVFICWLSYLFAHFLVTENFVAVNCLSLTKLPPFSCDFRLSVQKEIVFSS